MTTTAPNSQTSDLLVAIHRQDGLLCVAGELDRTSAHHLMVALADLAGSSGEFWTLDLRGVSFCDVEGLRVLHRAHELARAHGRVLRLLHVPPLVSALLPLMGAAGQAALLRDRHPVRLVAAG